MSDVDVFFSFSDVFQDDDAKTANNQWCYQRMCKYRFCKRQIMDEMRFKRIQMASYSCCLYNIYHIGNTFFRVRK